LTELEAMSYNGPKIHHTDFNNLTFHL